MDEQLVRRYLADALCDALFRLPGPSRLSDIMGALPPTMRMSDAAAQELMGADPRFAPCETRWDLRHRQDLSERPLGGALELIVQAYGRPVPEPLLLTELCLSKQGDPEEFRTLLARLLEGNRNVGFDGQYYYLTRWLVNTSATEEQRLLYLNGLHNDEAFLKAQKKLLAPGLKGRTPLDTAEAVLKAYGGGLDNRGLGLVLWCHHGDRFDAATVLSAMLADERFVALSGPQWLGAGQARTLEKAAGKLRGEPTEQSEAVDLNALLQTAPAQRLRLNDEELRAVLHLVGSSRQPVTVDEILRDVLKLRPKQRNFGPAAYALEELLNSDLRLARVQRGQYLPRQNVPAWVRSVPGSLIPEALTVGPREVSPDVVLQPDELEADLREQVRSPFYEDQGEPDVALGEESADSTQMAIAHHHYRLGTAKLRLCDRRLFNVPAPVAMVWFQSPDETLFPVWVNTETRLLYGLLPWYREWLHPTGSLLTIRRLPARVGAFALEYNGETDPGTYIGRERFAQVLDLGERLRRRRAFRLETITELLGQSEKGLPFDQLWAQVNLIVRSTRLQVASILSHYPQFSLAGGRWMLTDGQ
ncbi:MAG: hypothetical protein HPY69_07375 [Armatimonadetes bacterium]|nr:hypothetical protein [Armatimonadota bacterium]